MPLLRSAPVEWCPISRTSDLVRPGRESLRHYRRRFTSPCTGVARRVPRIDYCANAVRLSFARPAEALTNRVVDVTPTLDGFDVSVHRGEVRAHCHDRYVAPPGVPPRCNVARPSVVPATVLLDGFEPECIAIPSELDKLGFDPRLDLNRLGLSPAREQKSVRDPGRPVVRSLAETSQPDRDHPFRAWQSPGSVDPVVGVLVVDHRLFPQLADQGDLLLLPLTAAAKMSGHFETVVFHPVPAD